MLVLIGLGAVVLVVITVVALGTGGLRGAVPSATDPRTLLIGKWSGACGGYSAADRTIFEFFPDGQLHTKNQRSASPTTNERYSVDGNTISITEEGVPQVTLDFVIREDTITLTGAGRSCDLNRRTEMRTITQSDVVGHWRIGGCGGTIPYFSSSSFAGQRRQVSETEFLDNGTVIIDQQSLDYMFLDDTRMEIGRDASMIVLDTQALGNELTLIYGDYQCTLTRM